MRREKRTVYNPGKTKNGKISMFAVLCPLLFVLCSLLFSCKNTFSSDNLNKEPEITVPAGMGYIKLTVKEPNARTIVPGTTRDNFALYRFDFYKAGTTDIVETETRTNIDLSDPFFFNPGDYYLIVTAFMGPGATNPAAQGRLDDIEIIEGIGDDYEVTLKAFINSGSGTFSWNITISAELTGVTMNMEIQPLSPSGTNNVPVQTNRIGVYTLNSGYYSVIINLSKNDAEDIIWRNVLHIYQNMESLLEYTFTELHFSNNFHTVTFVYNNDDNNGIVNVIDGDSVAEPPDPVWDKGTFQGWYTDTGTFQDE